jgi:hypothetical protein
LNYHIIENTNSVPVDDVLLEKLNENVEISLQSLGAAEKQRITFNLRVSQFSDFAHSLMNIMNLTDL